MVGRRRWQRSQNVVEFSQLEFDFDLALLCGGREFVAIYWVVEVCVCVYV